jgi:hypothetical protein
MDFTGFRNEIIQLVDRADGTFAGCRYAGDRLWDLEDAVKELFLGSPRPRISCASTSTSTGCGGK